MKKFALLLTILFPFISFSQSLLEQEVQLEKQLSEIRLATNTTTQKKLNESFKKELLKAIESDNSFNYSFSKLKTLGCITSPDNKVRIYNWNIEDQEQNQTYFGFIQRFDEKKKKYIIYELKDNVATQKKTNEVVENNNWYGALYYKIIPVERNKKTYYTLLGWDGNNAMSNIKMIDALHFSGTSAKFGAPIFRWNKDALNRVWFEYSKDVIMHLNYEDRYKRIIFDHLAPQTPALTGFYSTYTPDLSNDAMIFQDGRWYLIEDVVGVNNPAPEKLTLYVPNEKTGQLEEKKIKNKWIEPSKQHVTALPTEDGINVKSEASKNESVKEKEKKDRKAPVSYIPTTNGKPNKKK